MVDSEWLDSVVGRRSEEAGVELINESVKRDDAQLLRVQLLSHQLHTLYTHTQHYNSEW